MNGSIAIATRFEYEEKTDAGHRKVIHIAGNLPPLIAVVLYSDRIWIKELKKRT